MEHELILHAMHSSSLRMFAQGVDWLSRADHLEGVIQVIQSMQECMPLHLDPAALDHWPALKELLAEMVWPIAWGTSLMPEGWFTEDHGSGSYVWTPTAAEIVVEQPGQAG